MDNEVEHKHQHHTEHKAEENKHKEELEEEENKGEDELEEEEVTCSSDSEIGDALEDVCLSSTRVALEFYRAARDAILLYEVVVPIKLERQLDGINQVAVLLMNNDCLYISQEILGFSFEPIDSGAGFQNTHQMQQFESAKFSIDLVIFLLI